MNRLRIPRSTTINKHSYLIFVQSIVPFFRYPLKNWLNVLSQKKNFSCRNKLSQLIITHIELTQAHKKKLINMLRAWSLMVSSKKSRVHGDHRRELLQKLTDLRVSVPIAGTLVINSSPEKHSQSPISSLIPIKSRAQHS